MKGLLENPWRYDYCQALRLLENGAVPGVGGEPLGGDGAPRDEVVRLRASPALGFPVNAIESLARRGRDGAGPLELTVTFMGAFGALGSLPWHYTEYVYERLSRRDRSLRDFVDALQHRSLAFHYRAWRKYRLPFAYEAAARRGEVDDVTTAIRALVGLGTSHLRERLPEGAERWLYFAGLFSRGRRTTAGLEVMLRALCGHRVEVREFVGRWQELLPEERSRLGGVPGGGCNNRLGSSLILGSRVWDVLSGVRVVIGPLDSRRLAELAPGTGRFPWLADLVRSYLGPHVEFEITGLVERSSIGPFRLGATAEDGGAKLGSGAWIRAETPAGYDTEVPLCSSR